MKTTILTSILCLVMISLRAQKTPQGINQFERELFVKRVQLLAWVKHTLKNEYYFASNYQTEDQMQLFGEAKRFLAVYGKNLENAFMDLSNFCPGTNYQEFSQLEEGMNINQELFILIHLNDDWVFQFRMGAAVNSITLSEWKNTDWSEYDVVPKVEGSEKIDEIIEQ